MSDPDTAGGPAPARLLRTVVPRAVGVVAVLTAAGALVGVLWQWVWSPPSGVVIRQQWFPIPGQVGQVFDGTGLYVLLASLTGAVVTALLVWAWPGDELATLLAVAVGSMLAGWLMYTVGHALGPDDPQVLAKAAERGTELPSDLRLAGLDRAPRLFRFDSSALAAWPLGAVLGFAGATLTTRGRRTSTEPGGAG